MVDLLEGIRVIESASLYNGDRLGCLLGDLGADVIKVENPRGGDYIRDIVGQITSHHSPAHVQVNRNKRSLAVDLKSDGGLEVFWRLVSTADVFVDGNVAGVCDRLGIGYEAMRARQPKIIFCHYSGFGFEGPYARIPTHGMMPPALVGAFPVEVDDSGLTQRIPLLRGPQGSNHSGGEGTATGAIYGAYHVAAALVRAQKSGIGCFIDVASADAVAANAYINNTYVLNWDRIVDTSTIMNADDQANARYQFYQTRDGKFALLCAIEPKFWNRFCQVIGRPELGTRIGEQAIDYGASDLELRHELQAVFAQRDLAEWLTLAVEHQLPIGPAYRDFGEAADDPHVRARGVIHEGEHPHAGHFDYLMQPALVDGRAAEVHRPAPLLGEHTTEVLAEIGYDTVAIAAMKAEGVVSGVRADNEHLPDATRMNNAAGGR